MCLVWSLKYFISRPNVPRVTNRFYFYFCTCDWGFFCVCLGFLCVYVWVLVVRVWSCICVSSFFVSLRPQHTHLHTHMHTHTHTHTHMHAHTHTHTHTHTYKHTLTHLYTHTHTHARTHARSEEERRMEVAKYGKVKFLKSSLCTGHWRFCFSHSLRIFWEFAHIWVSVNGRLVRRGLGFNFENWQNCLVEKTITKRGKKG